MGKAFQFSFGPFDLEIQKKIATWTFREEVVRSSQRQYLKKFKCIM